MDPLHQLYWLVTAHFFADYPLQSDYIAANKNPARSPTWFWVLGAHAATHGGFVALILGNPAWGLAEGAAHFVTDYAKCRGLFGPDPRATHIDQIVHIAFKVLWIWLAHIAQLPSFWGP